jgi:hypothetical protein
MRRIDDFSQSEALAALYLCRRLLRVQQWYLADDRKRNPLASQEYSEWKVKEALDDLWAAQERVKAFGLDWLDPAFYREEEVA